MLNVPSPIYMPEDPRTKALREVIMGISHDISGGLVRQGQTQQLQGILDLFKSGQPIDLSNIPVKDPGVVAGLLPNILGYNQTIMQGQQEAQAQASKPVKMTLRKGNKVKEVMVPQDRWNDMADQFSEIGWSVSDKELPTTPGPKEIQIGDENVTVVPKLDTDGNPVTDDSGQIIYEPMMVGGKQARGPVKVPTVNVNVGGKPAPTEERKQLTDLMSLSGNLQRINPDKASNPDTLYDSRYVGVVAGRKGSIGSAIGYPPVEDKQVQFMQVTDDMKDALLRARSGAQINEQEYQRLVKFLPDYTKPEKTFINRWRAFKTTLDNTIKQKQQALGESGFVVPTQLKSNQVKVQNAGTTSPYVLTKTLDGVMYGKTKSGQWVRIGGK